MIKGTKHKDETKQRISKKMEGNLNAEKWTEETVLPILERFYDLAKNDPNNKIILINDLLITQDLYKEIWSEWTEKFKNVESVFQLIKRIEIVLESKLYNTALKGDFNSTMAIFGLKNKYGWKDKHETSLTGGTDESGNDKPIEIKGEVNVNDLINALNAKR